MPPPIPDKDEWKDFWQKLSYGTISVCGFFLCFMINRFMTKFDIVTDEVATLERVTTQQTDQLKRNSHLLDKLKNAVWRHGKAEENEPSD